MKKKQREELKLSERTLNPDSRNQKLEGLKELKSLKFDIDLGEGIHEYSQNANLLDKNNNEEDVEVSYMAEDTFNEDDDQEDSIINTDRNVGGGNRDLLRSSGLNSLKNVEKEVKQPTDVDFGL